MMVVRQIQVKSILNKSKLADREFSANPYVGCTHDCKYCFASYMQRFSQHREDWGKFVDIKYWPPISLKEKEKLFGRKVWIGTVTDAYQPLEQQYQRTYALLRELQGTGCQPSFITKSSLILRDLELIKSFPQPQVLCSINTLDERFRFDMDQAAPLYQRFQVLQTCKAHGIKAICMIAPIFPEITNVFAIIDYVRDKCDEIWMDPLNLRGPNRAIIFNYIAQVFPQLFPLYQRIYGQGDESYWIYLSQQIAAFAQHRGMFFNNEPPAPPAQVFYPAPNVLCTFGAFSNLHFRAQKAPTTPTTAASSQVLATSEALSATSEALSATSAALSAASETLSATSEAIPKTGSDSIGRPGVDKSAVSMSAPTQAQAGNTSQPDSQDLPLFAGLNLKNQ